MKNVVEGTENEADMLWSGPVSKCRKDTNYFGWIIKMGENIFSGLVHRFY